MVRAPRRALLVAVVVSLSLGRAPADERPTSPWGTDLAAGRLRAAREERPLAVLFRCEP